MGENHIVQCSRMNGLNKKREGRPGMAEAEGGGEGRNGREGGIIEGEGGKSMK